MSATVRPRPKAATLIRPRSTGVTSIVSRAVKSSLFAGALSAAGARTQRRRRARDLVQAADGEATVRQPVVNRVDAESEHAVLDRRTSDSLDAGAENGDLVGTGLLDGHGLGNTSVLLMFRRTSVPVKPFRAKWLRSIVEQIGLSVG